MTDFSVEMITDPSSVEEASHELVVRDFVSACGTRSPVNKRQKNGYDN